MQLNTCGGTLETDITSLRVFMATRRKKLNKSPQIELFVMHKQKALNNIEIKFRSFALHIRIDFMLVSVSPNELFLD